MFVTADQLICHAFGDYVVQSDYMATVKTKSSSAALAHAVSYALCFIPLTCAWTSFGWSPSTWLPSSVRWSALLFICTTHFIIDRWRLARYACWAKNFLAPRHIEVLHPDGHPEAGKSAGWIRNAPWSECSGTGYDSSKPPWMAVWLMIIADNCFHVLCNAAALAWL